MKYVQQAILHSHLDSYFTLEFSSIGNHRASITQWRGERRRGTYKELKLTGVTREEVSRVGLEHRLVRLVEHRVGEQASVLRADLSVSRFGIQNSDPIKSSSAQNKRGTTNAVDSRAYNQMALKPIRRDAPDAAS